MYVAWTITEEPSALQDKLDPLKWDPSRSKFRDLDIQIQGLSEMQLKQVLRKEKPGGVQE